MGVTSLPNFPSKVTMSSGRDGCDEDRCRKAISDTVPCLGTAATCCKYSQVVAGATASNKKDAFLHTISMESGVECIEWMVDAKRLSSSDRQIVSPCFQLSADGLKQLKLKFILHACSLKTGRGKASFGHSGGRGSLSLKSDEVNFEGHELGSVIYRVPVGDSHTEWQSHDFIKTPLLRCAEEWNLRKAVDKSTEHAKVRLEIKTQRTIDCLFRSGK